MKKQLFILLSLIALLVTAQVPQRFNKVIVTGDIVSPKFIKTGSTVDSVLLGNGSARSVNSLKTDTVNLSNRINAKATGSGTANGTNTGDETLTSIKTKLGAATAVSDGYLKYQDYVKFDGKLSSEVDGSVTNELQTISTTGAAGNITLSNSGGTLNLNVNDADASTTNEIQDLSLSGNTLSLSSDATTVDVSQATAVLANTAKVSNATHTGDVTGSTALTLATVNSNIGTYNNVTINAKGLATAGSNVSYLTGITSGQVTTALGYTPKPTFTENTGFNKNFGTTAGTVLEGRTFGTAANSAVGDFIQNQNTSYQNSTFKLADGINYIGSNTTSGDNSALLIGRSLTGGLGSTGAHGVRDETLYNSDATDGLRAYCSFDAIATITGSAAFNHYAGHQSRATYNGTGLISDLLGYTSYPTINGNVIDNIGFTVYDPLGTGDVFNNVGINIKPLVRGTNNYAIITEGTTPSLFGGAITVDSDINANGQIKGANFYTGAGNQSVGFGNGVAVFSSNTGAPGYYDVNIGHNAGHNISSSNYTTNVGAQSGYTATSSNGSTNIGAFSGYYGNGSNNIFLGNYAGYYETGSDKLIIDNQQGTDEANARTRAMFYGVFNPTVASQTLTINAATTISNILNANQLQSTVATGTAPLTVNSTTMVNNLNTQYLGGYLQDENATDNTIVKRSGSGLAMITSGYLKTTLANIDVVTPTEFFTGIGDGVLRRSSKNAVNALLNSGLTTNYIPKWNGSSFGNSLISGNDTTILVNSTTSSTSPTTGALVVGGGIGVGGSINTSGSISISTADQSSSRLIINNTGTNGHRFDLIAGVNNFSQDHFSLWDNTAGITRFVVDNNGDFNIGYSLSQGYKLAVNGAGYFNGALTATSFVKSGGTSSQFLKANGSVDATNYQPAITLTTNGASGAATFSGNTLNVPNYSGVAAGDSYTCIERYNHGVTIGLATAYFTKVGNITSIAINADCTTTATGWCSIQLLTPSVSSPNWSATCNAFITGASPAVLQAFLQVESPDYVTIVFYSTATGVPVKITVTGMTK